MSKTTRLSIANELLVINESGYTAGRAAGLGSRAPYVGYESGPGDPLVHFLWREYQTGWSAGQAQLRKDIATYLEGNA